MTKFYTGNTFFCGTQIPKGATAEKCKWQHKDITYFEQMNLPGLSRDEASKAFDEAWKQISDVCDIRPRRVYSSVGANVVATTNRIDGPYGTLAWSYIPCGSPSTATMDQLYDNGESWNYKFFMICATHELIHALGIHHLNSGNIMQPMLDLNITKPQSGDIYELQARYGPPVNIPTPQPPTPVPPTPILLTPDSKFRQYPIGLNEIKSFLLGVPRNLFGRPKPYLFIIKNIDAMIAVYDTAGNPKGFTDDKKRLTVKLSPGEYIIQIRNKGEAGNFQIGAAKA